MSPNLGMRCSIEISNVIVKYKVVQHLRVFLHLHSSLPYRPFRLPHPLTITDHAHWYVLASSRRTVTGPLKLRTDQLHFDTQSTSYQTEGRIFFSLLILAGNILVPLMVLSAHLSQNQYSKSPIFMNLCYSLIFYSTTFLLS